MLNKEKENQSYICKIPIINLIIINNRDHGL